MNDSNISDSEIDEYYYSQPNGTVESERMHETVATNSNIIDINSSTPNIRSKFDDSALLVVQPITTESVVLNQSNEVSHGIKDNTTVTTQLISKKKNLCTIWNFFLIYPIYLIIFNI